MIGHMDEVHCYNKVIALIKVKILPYLLCFLEKDLIYVGTYERLFKESGFRVGGVKLSTLLSVGLTQ